MSPKKPCKEEMEMNFTIQLFLRPIFEWIAKGDQEEFCLRNSVGPCSVSGVMSLVKFFLLGGVTWIQRSREITGVNDIRGTRSDLSKFLLALNSSSSTRSLNWVLQISSSWAQTPPCFLDSATLALWQTLPLQWGHCSKLPYCKRAV